MAFIEPMHRDKPHITYSMALHIWNAQPSFQGLLENRKSTSVKAILTLKHRETHGCVVSTVATDALVLKHQAISIHNAD